MDFIKDSAVKTVNGIKTEFAKTAKRERQNGETERQNGKTTSEIRNGKMQNDETKIAKRSKRKTAKRQTVKTVNGQNGQF